MVDYLTDVLPSEVLSRFLELLFAPAKNPDMIWMTIPLLISTLLMTLYFGKHRTEDLGWNTAFGNSMALMFVSLDCLRYISSLNQDMIAAFTSALFRTATSVFVLLYAFALLALNFFHKMPKGVSFFISASLPINLFAYVTLSVVYSEVNVDIPMILASMLLFIILYFGLSILRLASTGYFLPKEPQAGEKKQPGSAGNEAVEKAGAEKKEKAK